MRVQRCMVVILFFVLVQLPILELPAQVDSVTLSQQVQSNHFHTTDSLFNTRQLLIDSIIEYGKTFLGVQYRYGGITPQGFDCSGFMFHIHRHFNLPLPRVPSATCLMGDMIDVDSVQPGDLVYFKTRGAYDNSIGHVGLVVEKTPESFMMLHSASHTGVVIENFGQKKYYVDRFLFANRLPDEFYLRQWNDSLMKIYSYKNVDIYNSYCSNIVPATQPEGTSLLIYTVKQGDMLGLIASWYKVSVNELMAWNGLGSTRLSIGQNITVYVPEATAHIFSNMNNLTYNEKQRLAGVNTSAPANASKPVADDNEYEYYIVQKGDTPFSISKKYHGTTAEGIMQLNGISNASSLQIGQKLKIRKKQ